MPLSLGFAACSFLPRNKLGKGMEALQYAYTERNTSKYLSLKMLWPAKLHYPAMSQQPLIFCVVPHGYAPLGITAYPAYSRLCGGFCRWTAVDPGAANRDGSTRRRSGQGAGNPA
mgnify:CR=1 FL=1